MTKSFLYIGCSKFGALFEIVEAYNGPFMVRHFSNSDGLLRVSLLDVGGENGTLFVTQNGHGEHCKQIAAEHFTRWVGCTLDEARASAQDRSHELETA